MGVLEYTVIRILARRVSIILLLDLTLGNAQNYIIM